MAGSADCNHVGLRFGFTKSDVMRVPSNRATPPCIWESHNAIRLNLPTRNFPNAQHRFASSAVERETNPVCSAAPLKSIDHEMLAGHEHMRLGGQIAHDAGDVLGRTDPAQGNSGGQLSL